MSEHIQDDDLDTGAPAQQQNGQAVSDDDIRAMLDQERAKRANLEQELHRERGERTRAIQTAQSAHLNRFDAEVDAVKARIDQAETEAKTLKGAYSQALQEGDFDKAADLQDKLAEIRAKQLSEKQYQLHLEGERNRLKNQPPPQPPRQQDGIDIASYTAGQQAWIKKNPTFMSDPKVREKTQAGHWLAVSDGHAVDSPEYFRVINETVYGKQRQQEQDQDLDTDPPPPPRRRPEPSVEMPVTRRTAPDRQAERNPRQVRLSAEQMEAADIAMSDIPVEGRHDQNGKWVPGRYERYFINSQKLAGRRS